MSRSSKEAYNNGFVPGAESEPGICKRSLDQNLTKLEETHRRQKELFKQEIENAKRIRVISK